VCSNALKHAEEVLRLFHKHKPGTISQSVAFTYTMLAWKAWPKTWQTNVGAPNLSEIIQINPKTVRAAFGKLEKLGLITKVVRLGITNETLITKFTLPDLEVYLDPPSDVGGSDDRPTI